ncbi:hypothetical protein VitviT2T_005300 [Vitis vinifera]|uniref:Uncharacterized protein n=1 Tax=Vitis vinifera TaxID=29760 RepID=A0ABY9BS56_VITVI|nr:hypothetical protein VitviT2T_005300 [Vitis vinifera]
MQSTGYMFISVEPVLQISHIDDNLYMTRFTFDKVQTLEMEDFCQDFVAMSFDQHDSNIRLFGLAEKRDARVGLQRQDLNESIGMAVESNRIRGLQKLLINHAENPDIVIRTCSGSHYTILLIGHLHELADDKGHGLNPLDLLLVLKELPLEILLLILGIFFLDVDELELTLEGFKAAK